MFGEEALRPLIVPYLGRELGADDLEALRLALTRLYVDNGYVNSGAILPDQTVTDGTVTYIIVEGRLAEISVSGNRYLRDQFIALRLATDAEPPLDIDRLQENVQLLHEDPRIQRMDARLSPTEERGAARLDVEVEERSPLSVQLSFNNQRPPSVGAEQLQAIVTHRSLSGIGDVLSVQGSHSEGLDQLGISYQVPLSPRDTALTVYYLRTDSEIVEPPADVLDIRSYSRTTGMSLTHPVIRSARRELILGLIFETKYNETTLLGQPSFLVPAAQDGVMRVTPLRLTQEWRQRSRSEVVALRSQITIGLDALDATVSQEGFADGRYVSWLGQLRWIRRLHDGAEIAVRTDLQVADGGLLPLEQIAIGGLTTVRGYRENQLVGDQGLVASAEYRFPVFPRRLSPAILQLITFADYGAVDNRLLPDPEDDSLASIGAGVRWTQYRTGTLEVYYGHRLHRLTRTGDDLQDDGIHFRFLGNWE